MSLNKADVNVVKSEIEYTIGRKILTSKDCIDLSEAIFKKTEYRINSNTLRRFFGLVKSEYPASISTLNILAIYCGASSFEDLLIYRRNSRELLEKEAPNLVKYLTILFQNITVPSVNDHTFIKLTHTTIDFLNQNLEVAYQFQKAIAKTNNGKLFYFEKFVNVDKLNSFYGRGLRYYLAENKAKDAQIFGNALLCFRYWLTMDIKNLEYHHKILTGHAVSEDIHLCTSARYFAARLYYAEAMGLDCSHIIWEAQEFYLSIKSTTKHTGRLPCFEFIMSEALILTNHYSDALIYTKEGLRAIQSTPQPSIDLSLLKSIKLYHAVVLFNLGNNKEAAELFNEINPFEFYFITKQFHSIMYILLGVKLNKIRSGKEQLDFIIETTGFKKLVELCTVTSNT